MALMGETDRARTAAQINRDNLTACSFSKVDVRAAVDATDQWIEDNTASWNSSLPTGFSTTASAAQKAWLFAYVLMRRIGRLRAEEDG